VIQQFLPLKIELKKKPPKRKQKNKSPEEKSKAVSIDKKKAVFSNRTGSAEKNVSKVDIL